MVQTRVVHYKRFIIADEDAEGSAWFDVERIDDLKSKQGQGPSHLRAIRREFWGDEEDDASHPTRELTEKVYPNPTNSSQRLRINAIDQMLTKSGQGPSFLKNTKRYRNHDNNTNTIRIFQVRRVFHADATINANGKYVKQQPTAEDRKKYIDVALLKKIIQKTGQGPTYKKRTLLLNYEPLTEYSELIEDDVLTVGDGVVYLDPFQNIINVQWPDDDEGPDEDDEPEEPPFQTWTLGRLNMGANPGHISPGSSDVLIDSTTHEDIASAMAAFAGYPYRPVDQFHQIIMPHEFYGSFPDEASAVDVRNIYSDYYWANLHSWPSYPPHLTQVPGNGFILLD